MRLSSYLASQWTAPFACTLHSCSALDCAGAAVWCSHTIETRRRHGLLRCGVRQRTERHRFSWQHGCDRSRLRSSLSPPSPCGIARRRRGQHHHRRRETSGRRGGGVRAGGLHWRRRYVTCGAISCTGTVPDWSPVCNGARLWLQWPTQGVPAGLCCLQTAHSKAFWAGLTLDAYPCGVPDHWLALMADTIGRVAPRPRSLRAAPSWIVLARLRE